MKLIVLGSGTCASQLPGVPNRYPPGFLVTWGENEQNKILFECSEGIRFRLEQAGYDYCDIHHIAISHAHPDHYALVHYYQSVFGRILYFDEDEKCRGRELHIYCPNQIADDFSALFRAYNPEWGDAQEYWWPKLIFHKMSVLYRYESRLAQEEFLHAYLKESAMLRAMGAYHGFGKVDALAFRLITRDGVFAYSGDTGFCRNVYSVANGADIFVCEASSRVGDDHTPYTPKGFGHLTPYLCGDIARNGAVKKLILFHYTGLDSDEAMIEDCRRSGFNGEIVIAKDFEVLEVSSS